MIFSLDLMHMSFDWNASDIEIHAALEVGVDVDCSESKIPRFCRVDYIDFPTPGKAVCAANFPLVLSAEYTF
jgi:hypothetical protein